MTLRSAVTTAHVVLACGAMLAWCLALVARRGRWRQLHRPAGRLFCGLVVLSSLLAAGLAADARNRFGLAFVLQPLVLALSGLAWQQARLRVVQVMGLCGAVVAAAVMHGFVQFLATRALIDVLAFAVTPLVMVTWAVQDLRAQPGSRRQAHAWRLLAAGWFYLAELIIFLADPQPSVIAWALAAVVPLGAWAVLRHSLPLARREPGHG